MKVAKEVCITFSEEGEILQVTIDRVEGSYPFILKPYAEDIMRTSRAMLISKAMTDLRNYARQFGDLQYIMFADEYEKAMNIGSN